MELLGQGAYEGEFCDADGQTYAQLALWPEYVMPLHSQGKLLCLTLAEARPRGRRNPVRRRILKPGKLTP